MAELQLTAPEAANNLVNAIGEFIECRIREALDKGLSAIVEERRAPKAEEAQAAQFMTVAETAKALGISKHYLYKMMSRKQIPYYKPRGKVAYFKRSEVEQIALTNRVSTMAESTQAAAAYIVGKEAKK